MNNRSIFFFFVLLKLISISLIPKNLPASFEYVLFDNNYKDTSVYCIIQDNIGFLWLGTNRGLLRYNGYDVETFTHNRSDPNSLSNHIIRSLYKDKDGIIWIGTGGGLNRFNPETGQFKSYTHHQNDLNSISHNEITTICEDHFENLWIGTFGGGLNKFNKKTETFIHYKNKPEIPWSLSNDIINSVFVDSLNILWVGTNIGLNTLNLSRKDQQINSIQFKHYKQKNNISGNISHSYIWKIYEDRQGTIWVGTEKGLNKYSRKNDQFSTYLHDPVNKKSISHNNIRMILEDSRGKFWVGTSGGGFNHLDRSTGNFTVFKHRDKSSNSFRQNIITSIYEDRSGLIWIATYGGGLWKYNRSKELFNEFQPQHTDLSYFDKPIWAILEDNNGLLIGTFGDGLHKYDQKGEVKIFKNDPNNSKSLSSDRISAIFKDSFERIWVGTFGGGVNLYQDGQFKRYKKDPKNQKSLGSNVVSLIHEDNERQLWVGTFSGGLNKWDPTKNSFIRYINDPLNKSDLSIRNVLSLYEDKKGIFWIGSNNGLIRFDRKSNSFKYYRHNPKNKKSLSHNRIYAICEDNSGFLWIGTGGKGLNKFDKQKKEFSYFTVEDGLSSNLISNIQIDNSGKLWIGTNNGLSSFNPKNGKFKKYSHQEGLSKKWINPGASFKAKNGRLYFGAMNGLNALIPEKIVANPFKAPIVITAFKKFNKKVKTKVPLSHLKFLELNPQDHIFSFEFAALDFTASKKNKYAYKMEGLHKDWVYTDAKSRFAHFTSLAPGNYIFRVKGSNNDSIWNEKGIAIKLYIKPPFWKTWWAYSIYLIFIITLLYISYRIRTGNLRKREKMLSRLVKRRTEELSRSNEELYIINQSLEKTMAELSQSHDELKKVNQLKSDMLGIAAHDLKNPLQVIMGISEMIKDRIDDKEFILNNLNTINRSSSKMINLITGFLETVVVKDEGIQLNSIRLDFGKLVESVIENNRTKIEKKGQKVILDIAKAGYVIGDKMILQQVVDNLIDNAIKFSSPKKTIWVTLTTQKKIIELNVKDEGPGLKEEEITKLFKKFQRLSPRPTAGEPSTGLGLYLCKNFIKLHKGRIDVESFQGQGTTFTVVLPRVQDN